MTKEARSILFQRVLNTARNNADGLHTSDRVQILVQDAHYGAQGTILNVTEEANLNKSYTVKLDHTIGEPDIPPMQYQASELKNLRWE